MTASVWQKSSYCAQGNSCVHVAAGNGTVRVRESGDPTGAILHTTPTALHALLRALKQEQHPHG
ncbi:DUF397 domain-containing protein [Streptomyces sp. NPDC005775]|uniref:DUF397 domain-containing protein n=1 Tax=unclassified Streptomyces TaxID=2593676 RepID=UPI0033E74DF4